MIEFATYKKQLTVNSYIQHYQLYQSVATLYLIYKTITFNEILPIEIKLSHVYIVL